MRLRNLFDLNWGDALALLCLANIPFWFYLVVLHGEAGLSDPWFYVRVASVTFLGFTIARIWQYGNPKTWWATWESTTITVDLSKIVDREVQGESSDQIQREILDWVYTGVRGRWVKINPYSYKFRRKGDAMFFKLAWG